MDNLNQEVHELSMYLTAISMEDSINLAPAVECALSKGIVVRYSIVRNKRRPYVY